MEKVTDAIRTIRRNILHGALFLAALFLFFGMSDGPGYPEARSSTSDEIRVGLKSFFSGKQSIVIENSELELGYCDGREFVRETILFSENGIRVTAEKGSFFSVSETFSLKRAEELAAKLTGAGAKAYAVMLFSGTAGIYLPVTENGISEKYARDLCEATAKQCGVTLTGGAEKSAYLLRLEADERILFADGAQGKYPQFAAIKKDKDGIPAVNLGSRSYRGRIEIGRYGGASTVTAVNVVPLEEYLYGVVPCEMPAGWHMEALKAQAVCARSYALVKAGYHAETDIKRGFRMSDTVQSQVYGGITYEHERSNAAVNATRGQTLCYENRTVAGYYFAASGGHTENIEDVWGISVPYLQGVPDIYEKNPSQLPWSVTLSRKELERILLSAGENVGTIKKVMQEITTSSGRVYSMRIIGSLAGAGLRTEALRNVLEFASTKFKVISPDMIPDRVTVQGISGAKETTIHDCYIMSGDGRIQSADGLTEQYIVLSADNLTNFPRYAPGEGEYLFAGMGHGHGVGMSQSGANGMAEQGFTYKEILEYYFTGISVR